MHTGDYGRRFRRLRRQFVAKFDDSPRKRRHDTTDTMTFSTANLKIRRQSLFGDCRRIFKLAVEKSPLCPLCRVVSQIPLQRLGAKLPTGWKQVGNSSSTGNRGNVCNGFWALQLACVQYLRLMLIALRISRQPRLFLADRTAAHCTVLSAIGVILSSVRLSVTLCIVALGIAVQYMAERCTSVFIVGKFLILSVQTLLL